MFSTYRIPQQEPTQPLSAALEAKARALAEKMGVVQGVRFEINPNTEGRATGYNFRWSRPTISICRREDDCSLWVLGHQLARLRGHQKLTEELLNTAATTTLLAALTIPETWGPALGTVVISQAIQLALTRWNERQADLQAAAHLDAKALASGIRHCNILATEGTLRYQMADNDPLMTKWLTRIMLTPKGNNRLNTPHATRAEHLLNLYEERYGNAPLSIDDGISNNIRILPEKLISTLRRMVSDSTRRDKLFDAHTVQLLDTDKYNVVVQTSGDPYYYTVSPDTIRRYQNAVRSKDPAASEILIDIVNQAITSPEWLRLTLKHPELLAVPKDEVKRKLLQRFGNALKGYDLDTINIRATDEENVFTVTILAKSDQEQ